MLTKLGKDVILKRFYVIYTGGETMLRNIMIGYVSLMPIIITGLLNAIFCKTSFLQFLKVPIDGGKVLKDGERLFGQNKTWKGFIGTPTICMIVFPIWGLICSINNSMSSLCCFYWENENTLLYNLVIGGLIGLVYAILELPNSYIKRRMRINSGKRVNGAVGFLFKVYDQIDSIIGIVLIMVLAGNMPMEMYLFYIIEGGITHLMLNCLLYGLRLRECIL